MRGLIGSVLLLACDTCALNVREGRVEVRGAQLYTRIVRPMPMTSQQHFPVIVCHGGVGSEYLWPLADLVPYRSVVFFDQLGCGRSGNASDYSIEAAVDDMTVLVKSLGLKRFHLYGHGFGGLSVNSSYIAKS